MRKIWGIIIGVVLFAALPALAFDQDGKPTGALSKPKIAEKDAAQVSEASSLSPSATSSASNKKLIVLSSATPLVSASKAIWPPQCSPIPDHGADICSAREAKFSGYWGLGSLIVSLITLATVFYGFWKSNQTQQAEFRAYLRIDLGNLKTAVNAAPILSANTPNYGRTPANKVTIIGEFWLANANWNWANVSEIKRGDVRADLMSIHPFQDFAIPIVAPFVLSEVQYAQIQSGDMFIYYRAAVFYDDVFGRAHETHISYRGGQGASMIAYGDGNWAN